MKGLTKGGPEMTAKEENKFIQGFACAVAMLMREHNYKTLGKYLIEDAGFTINDLIKAKVEKYDLDVIKKEIKMTAKENLKPCSFCGRKSSVEKISEQEFVIGCDNRYCHAFIDSSRGWTSKKLAIENWNRRSKGEKHAV